MREKNDNKNGTNHHGISKGGQDIVLHGALQSRFSMFIHLNKRPNDFLYLKFGFSILKIQNKRETEQFDDFEFFLGELGIRLITLKI